MYTIKLTTIALSTALLLTACGGGGSDSSGTGSSSNEIAPERAKTTALSGTVSSLPQTITTVRDAISAARAVPTTCPSGTKYDNALNDFSAPKKNVTVGTNFTLTDVAEAHATDLATYDYFSHRSRNGSGNAETDLNKRLSDGGYSTAGLSYSENIAGGTNTDTIEAAIEQWKKSPAHCDSFMNPAYKTIGVGYANNDNSTYKNYWVLILSSKDS
ncbi:MAG: CAP domain-containing protein [Moraxella sp.]|nr:CAP domain-containing protein [Moraxella sp.]